MTNVFKEQYSKNAVPALKKEFGYTNDMSVPAIEKVVINVSSGEALTDEKLKKTITDTLTRITGQKAVPRGAKKSISNFKVRKDMIVGWKVTLRGKRMEDFLTKLIHVALPRVRDFRGISRKSFDGNGNYTIGIREHLVFPEIKPDEVEKLHGLEVSIHTSAKTNDEGYALLRGLGFPFND